MLPEYKSDLGDEMTAKEQRRGEEITRPAGIAASPKLKSGNAHDLLMLFDKAARCVYVSFGAAELFGLPREAIIGREVNELGLQSESLREFQEEISHAFFTGLMQSGGFWLSTRENYRYYEYTLTPIITSRQGVEYVTVTLEDKTRYRRAEEELLLSQERFAKLFRLSPSLMLLQDAANGVVIELNDAWCNHTGYDRDEIIGKTPEELDRLLATDFYRTMLAETARWGEHSSAAFNYQTKNGVARTAIVSRDIITVGGRPHVLSVAQDITEKERFTREINRLERLNLVGQMAAGLGHEIRNPLTTVRGFLQLLAAREEYQEDEEYFELMLGELDRANGIITEFLNLAQDKLADFARRDLNSIIRSLVPLLQADVALAGKTLEVMYGDIPTLKLDEKEIRQVILNLSRNGLEAMPPEGKLTISTAADAKTVSLFVRDNGPGIEPEVLKKLGTPFFTTKERGTGLGLATCLSIATRHGARLKFDTGRDGTTVSVVFTRDDQER